MSCGALGSPAGPQPWDDQEPTAVPAMVPGEWGTRGSFPTASIPTNPSPLDSRLVMI